MQYDTTFWSLSKEHTIFYMPMELDRLNLHTRAILYILNKNFNIFFYLYTY